VLNTLRRGAVIPAHPLALDESRRLDTVSQRALSRYYIDAGAGGLAVGVHTTQFQIREAGLYRPVLQLAAETARSWAKAPIVLIAGAIGRTEQAVGEARIARDLGYHAVLLGLAAMTGASEDELIAHCRAVADEMPVIGFYLQTAVGGIKLSRSFWSRFAAIDNVVAIKVAPFNRYRTLDVIHGIFSDCADFRLYLYSVIE
jgi:dihydrodipicolinate synthase/N-acetylneuraminate lyase